PVAMLRGDVARGGEFCWGRRLVMARAVSFAGEDRANHGGIALAAIMAAVELDLLLPPVDLWRASAFIGESDQHQPLDPFRLGLHKSGGADGARGRAGEMHLGLPGCACDHRYRGFEILDAAGDIGIIPRAARVAIAVVIHGPHVVAVAREYVHERILALARDAEVV